MNRQGLYFLVFTLGVVTGAATTLGYFKKKYEEIAQEEIDSVKEAFSAKNEHLEQLVKEVTTEKQAIANQAKDKPNLINYTSIVSNSRYTTQDQVKPDTSPEESNYGMKEKPYVISPEEFGDMDDYETFSLTYYLDGILADDNDDIIDDVEETIGADSLMHFGEYEDDSVFVRNDVRKSDYEILLDSRKYVDVIKRNPDKKHSFNIEVGE